MNQISLHQTAVLLFRVAATLFALNTVYQALIFIEYAIFLKSGVEGATFGTYIQCFVIPSAASLALWLLAPGLGGFVSKSIKQNS